MFPPAHRSPEPEQADWHVEAEQQFCTRFVHCAQPVAPGQSNGTCTSVSHSPQVLQSTHWSPEHMKLSAQSLVCTHLVRQALVAGSQV